MPTIYVFEQKYEKYQNFCLKIFIILVVKFSIYLNRRVFVMITGYSNALSEESVQIALMHRLISVFADRNCSMVREFAAYILFDVIRIQC